MSRVVARVSSGGSVAALLISLKLDPKIGLAGLLVDEKASVVEGDMTSSVVFRRCAECFVSAGATHALLELDYFDLDSRSNAAVTVGMRHQASRLAADRLTFLTLSSTPKGSLPAVLTAIAGADVLGYMVLTPDPYGAVGRSIIPVPLDAEGVRRDADVVLERQVRTAVWEPITLLGRTKMVRGIPFMQQDGNVLTCAHVAAWAAHYTAVLRGLAGRRPTAEFHTVAASVGERGRAFPSAGLTASQVATVLDRFGLPALDLNIVDFDSSGRDPAWYDRELIWSLNERLRQATGLTGDDDELDFHLAALEGQLREIDAELDELDEQLSDDDPQAKADYEAKVDALFDRGDAIVELLEDIADFWIRESVTRTVCQYLNSGFPLIVLDHARQHATLVVGYLRRSEVDPGRSGRVPRYGQSDTDVVGVIVADDQLGPYLVDSIESLVLRLANSPATRVLVPLPPEVWVSADDAEWLGSEVFVGLLEDCVEQLGTLDGHITQHGSDAQAAAVTDKLSALLAAVRAGGSTRYSLRSYLVPSTVFKATFAERCPDKVVAAEVAAASLPKFVWVVEVIDRNARKKHKPCVLGEVVLDATDTDLREANANIVHLPGAVRVKGRIPDHPSAVVPDRWHISKTHSLYESGRYRGKTLNVEENPMYRFANAKKTVV